MYDKDERYFEDKAVPDATMDDIDLELVQDYIEKIDYGKSAVQYLKENKGFVKIKKVRSRLAELQFYCLERIRNYFFHVLGFGLFDMKE